MANRGTKPTKDLRVLPSLIMNKVLIWTLAVIAVHMPEVENLGLIENIMVEAQDLFVFAIAGLGCRSHS